MRRRLRNRRRVQLLSGGRGERVGQRLHSGAQRDHRALQATHCLSQLAHFLLELVGGGRGGALGPEPFLHHALHALHEGRLQLLKHGLCAGLEGWQHPGLEGLAEGAG